MPLPKIDAFLSFLPVRDLDATERFYGGALGLRRTLDQGRCRVFEVRPDAHVGFCRSDRIPSGGRIILTIVTDDPDGWHEHLRGRGLAPGPVQDSAEFRIRHFFIEDPDGYQVEFQRFWDEDWRGGGGYLPPADPLA